MNADEIAGKFGAIGKLGFGLMRLPKVGDAIDIEQTKQMADMFLDAGFTYFDTAWAYEGSEDACPQHIAIRDELDRAVEALGLEKPAEA